MPATNVPWSPPLTRLNPWYPGQMGVPGTDNETGLRLDTNGAIFYVDPNAVGVSDQRDGTDPIEPLQTVAAALTHCQAYRNDVIVVAPSSFGPWSDMTVGRITPIAEEVTVSVPGVRIVGLFPPGVMGVPWTPIQNSGTCITVNAIDVLIEGFMFSSGTYTNGIAILAQWDGATLYGDNLTVRHCHFYTNLDYGIQLDESWYPNIHDNYFNGVDIEAVTSMGVLGDADFALVHDNVFMNNDNAIKFADVRNAAIYRNLIYGDATGTDNFIDLTGGANNIVADNWLGCTLAGNQYNTTCSDAGSGAWIRNHCIDGETGAAPT